MCGIAFGRVACCKAPAIGPVTFVVVGVFHAVHIINECVIAVELPVVGIAVLQSAGVETYPAVMCPEERPTLLDVVVMFEFKGQTVGDLIGNEGTVAGPALVICIGRNRVRGRR